MTNTITVLEINEFLSTTDCFLFYAKNEKDLAQLKRELSRKFFIPYNYKGKEIRCNFFTTNNRQKCFFAVKVDDNTVEVFEVRVSNYRYKITTCIKKYLKAKTD